MEIFSHHSLFKFNTFGIDVKAREYVQIADEADLAELISECRDKSRKLLILGRG